MKISGKFILKVAGTLTVISLIMALLLGLVNGVTADKIAAMNAAATQTALEAVTEAGSTYDEITSIPQEVMDAAKVSIDQSRKEAERQLRQEVGKFSVAIAEKLVRQQMADDKQQQALADKLLDEMEKNKN